MPPLVEPPLVEPPLVEAPLVEAPLVDVDAPSPEVLELELELVLVPLTSPPDVLVVDVDVLDPRGELAPPPVRIDAPPAPPSPPARPFAHATDAIAVAIIQHEKMFRIAAMMFCSPPVGP